MWKSIIYPERHIHHRHRFNKLEVLTNILLMIDAGDEDLDGRKYVEVSCIFQIKSDKKGQTSIRKKLKLNEEIYRKLSKKLQN